MEIFGLIYIIYNLIKEFFGDIGLIVTALILFIIAVIIGL